ncbi:effector binding domain-containing protein [Leptospira sp. 'Mane']|uniref:effector binding domain-containing protein n=1 Tax=Leptospira sp. 'Mane' TaxID=3387407 RepID=UPI00398B387A
MEHRTHLEYYDKIHSAIEFIERNLTKKISVQDVSDHAFSSLWHFQRIFRYMTGYSIHSYTRKRRLSEAGNELLLSKRKIIDIALKYQYETPETFLREFKKNYGTTPSQYRKSREHFMFEKIDIRSDQYKNVFDGTGIECKPMIRNQIAFIGKTFKTTMQKNQSMIDIPRIWESSFSENIFEKIPNRTAPNTVQGVYSNWDIDENFDFLVGCEVKENTPLPSGFVRHITPAAKYMVFTIPGNTSEKLVHGWKYIYGTWMPNSKYERGFCDDFDVFDARFQDPDHPVSDIYISIR